MPTAIETTYAHHPSSDLAILFAFAFSRLEFVLKRKGFHTNRPFLSADWRKFADRAPDCEACGIKDVVRAARYLLQFPAGREVLRDGIIIFETPRPRDGTTNQQLCDIIKTIRNNLFHGGKIPFDARDETLITSALVILEYLLQSNPSILAQFMDA